MSSLQATVAERRLTLYEGAALRLALRLDAGGRHRLVVGDDDIARRVVAALEDCPGVGVLPADGGLLGNQTVAGNFALVLRYDAAENRDPLDPDLDAAFRLCGMTPQRVETLAREQPMNLERGERWQLGFVRWLLRPPELLVIDRLF
ncbi:MAG: hypothetical protein HYY97_16395, partial [Rhodocyclales bacterium]|nr:hypothetical protein [Rhodocyclales bacterium]